MTSTSMLTPTAATLSRKGWSWKGWMRVAGVFFAVIVFATVAFAVGRSTVHVHRASPVIARSSISVPAFAGSVTDGCRTGRPPC
jgi:hypothetical protein